VPLRRSRRGRLNRSRCTGGSCPAWSWGRRVAAVLADGAQLEGKVRRVNPADLVLEITKTSAPHAYPKGVRTIPCEAVSTLQVKQRRWRIAGTLIGVGGGLTAGLWPTMFLCGELDRSAACRWSAWFVVTVVSAIGRYVAGRCPDLRAGRVRRVTCGGAAPAADGVLSEISKAGKLDWRSRVSVRPTAFLTNRGIDVVLEA